jgi:dimethylhistidine N-methyltransferase
MSAIVSPVSRPPVNEQVSAAVQRGLSSHPKTLPPWLLYDERGSGLFEQITDLPEYYLTRTERQILTAHAAAMIHAAADGKRLRIAELGAGSADKTRLLLAAAVQRQGAVLYEPVDVSASALEAARQRIEREIQGVRVAPRVEDYTIDFALDPPDPNERRLVLYIGSSIGNFEPVEALHILQGVRAELKPGDGLLLGVDLVKDPSLLLAAYDDAAGVTAAFNLNLLLRLNRQLDANFDLGAFAHQAVWNETHSRMEMHLKSRLRQTVRLGALNLDVEFAEGETIHSENSYKYQPGEIKALLAVAGFEQAQSWTDAQGWFEVVFGRAT